MRLLGLDLGTKTMGIAVTDSSKIVVNGLENFEYGNNNLNICVDKVKALIERYHGDLESIVLGYPTHINGSRSPRTDLIEKFAEMLKPYLPSGVRLILHDERYSTMRATGMMKFDVGLKASQIRKIKDKMSAVIILQDYLECHQDVCC
ncbi:MAG: Holliday junction resolvase RuvX [Mycoplasmataceae bacterium]|jgi:putative Holliday junction resolvase|nr:Holliday junction resolvase RuvX [Mycoplasmataceae bacterium]